MKSELLLGDREIGTQPLRVRSLTSDETSFEQRVGHAPHSTGHGTGLAS